MMTKGAMGEDGGCWGAAPGSEQGASRPALKAGRRKPAPFPPLLPRRWGEGTLPKWMALPKMDGGRAQLPPAPLPGRERGPEPWGRCKAP